MNQNDQSIAALASKFINGTGRHIFLTGRAGTGKTTFLKNIVESTHKKCIVAAPTGIAAINAGGVTLHSLFHLPFGSFIPGNIPVTHEQISVQLTTPRSLINGLQMNTVKRDMIREMELLIVDEVSMLRADILDAIDHILRYLRRKNNIPFGGVQMLFIGDLLQLPPIVKNEEYQYLRPWYKNLFFFEAKALINNPPVYVELDKIYRQTDSRFIDLLNNLRNNNLSETDIKLLNNYYEPEIQGGNKDGYIYLTTHNHKADTINRNSLARLPGKSYTYTASVNDDFGEHLYPVEYTMELKKGSQVMFIKNDYSGEQRYYNGKIGTVSSLSKDEIIVQFDDGSYTEVEKYTWENKRYTLNKKTNDIEEVITGSFIHFPIKLAWAITIHKSQGLTFEKAIIDVGSAFAPGQIYVALSRLTSLNGLILTSHITSKGLMINEDLKSFALNKSEPDEINQLYLSESKKYLQEFMFTTFDLSPLVFIIKKHLISYDKDEKKSTKQKHKPWAVKLYNDVFAQKGIADKFLLQLRQITENQKTDETIKIFHKRLVAAKKYYSDKFEDYIDEVNQQINHVKGHVGTKKYIKELDQLNNSLTSHLNKLYKAEALFQCVLNDEELHKKDLLPTRVVATSDNKTPGIPQKEKKIKKSIAQKKKPKGYTRELTLKLYNQGMSIPEIASLRSLAVSTIEGHLATSIKTGKLDVVQLVDENKIETVVNAMKNLDTRRLGDLRDHLGEEFSFADLRFIVAHVEWKNNI